MGYGVVCLYIGHKKTKNYTVHRLVLEAFVGPCPEGMECCHEDGDTSNNRLSNLRWDTKLGNHSDRRRHGTTPTGEKNYGAKLVADDVVRMREMYDSGKYTEKQLQSIFKLSKGQVNKIVRRKSWKHI